MKVLFVVSFFVLIAGNTSNASDWSYGEHNGPSDWAKSVNKICGLPFQSPINIAANQVIPDHSLRPLSFSGYHQSLHLTQFSNNGHTVVLALPEQTFTVADELNQTYTALQLHFHWAATDRSGGGSEHTVDGKHSPVEMHIVHIKNPYTSLDDIKDMRDGLLVIGVLLKADDSVKTSPYADILDPAPPIKGGTTTLSTNVKLQDLLPSSGSYYRYFGSLTTPPCYQAVKWTVMQEAVTIPSSTLHRLKTQVFKSTKKLYADDLMGGNYRPVQPLSGRKITEFLEFDSKDEEEEDHGWTYSGSKKTSKWTKMGDEGAVAEKDFQKCGMDRQSPININTQSTQQDSSQVGAIQFSDNYFQGTSGKLVQNGHTIMYALDQDSLTFREQSRSYRALQLHFHWAPVHFSDYNKEMEAVGGSEHTVDDMHYPIEMLLVYPTSTVDRRILTSRTLDIQLTSGENYYLPTKRKRVFERDFPYISPSMHIVHEKLSGVNVGGGDELAVLGAFFQLTTDENKVDKKADEALEKLSSNFMSVLYKDSSFDVDDGPTLKDLLPENAGYYRYMGSLTTPPCTESVLWTVYSSVLTVSQDRFFEFQRLLQRKHEESSNSTSKGAKIYNAYIAGNFRPTQDLNQRNVYVYQEASAPFQIFFYVVMIVIAVGLLILGVFIYKRAVSRAAASNSAKYTRGNTTADDCLHVNTEITNIDIDEEST